MRSLTTWGAAVAGAALLLLGTPLAATAAPGVTATPGTLLECETLIDFSYADTVISSVERVSAGAETNAGTPVGEHCLVTGFMNERVSPVDGDTYRIGFEMRLPADWAGRYLYQANGGMDGGVIPAMGSFTGGQLQSGLQQGFAVISSDAGHNGAQNPLFGYDPQARLDYGYQAVATLTPMAKALVEAGYGRGPDTSYFAGGSNGGRHTMVAAARYADQYDGFFAIAPGYNLPQAAVAQLWGAQQWNQVASTPGDITTAFSPEELAVVRSAVLTQCDDADGLADGMVQASALCQDLFNVQEHVPTCEADRDGTCLTADQKNVLERVFAGATTSAGEHFYDSFPFDAGITNSDWSGWKFNASVSLDPMAAAFLFSAPPESPAIFADIVGWSLSADIDALAAGIWETDGVYTESAMDYMTPPAATEMAALRASGGKLLVAHGASDAVFSSDNTVTWYEGLTARYGAETMDFARYFQVPGMAHVSGGAATDQFDGLGAIVAWVEQGVAPDRIEAAARGGANAEVPADWSATRTRPLCAYPNVALYVDGDPEVSTSFECGIAEAAQPEPEPEPKPDPQPKPDPEPAPDPNHAPAPDPTPGTGTDKTPVKQSTTAVDTGAKNLASTGSTAANMVWVSVIGATFLAGGLILVLLRRTKDRG